MPCILSVLARTMVSCSPVAPVVICSGVFTNDMGSVRDCAFQLHKRQKKLFQNLYSRMLTNSLFSGISKKKKYFPLL